MDNTRGLYEQVQGSQQECRRNTRGAGKLEKHLDGYLKPFGESRIKISTKILFFQNHLSFIGTL